MTGLACVGLGALAAAAQPQVLRRTVDDLYHGVTAGRLGRYALVYLAIALVAGAFRFFARWLVNGAAREIEYELRNTLFAHLQTMPAQYFQRERAGDLMSRLTNDLAAVRTMLGVAVMQGGNTLTVALLALGFMVAISPRLTLLSLLPLPLVSFVVWFAGERIQRRFEALQAQFAALVARVQESLAGVREVRAAARERHELAELEALNEAYRDRHLALTRASAAFDPALALLSGIATVLALWLGGGEVVAGRITLGQFVAFTVYLGMLNWPMVALGQVVSQLQRGTASWARLLDVLERAPAIANAHDARPLPFPRGEIEVRDLTFAYPGAPAPALRGVSFRVRAGEFVGIVGETGAGKSTLLSLLPRAYDPPAGAVFLDGMDVRELDLGDLRGALGWVMQEPFLFSGTLADNIAFGGWRPEAEAIVRAARRASLAEDVRAFPDGLATAVGERGVALSGGQRQRVAIARTLLGRGRVLLLDDCLSSVDAATERAVLDGLMAERGRRTLLLVSHRVRAVQDADTILVLERGRIVERGTHAALLARAGRYAALVRRQQLEEELAAS
ncbi:MAG TPA: ABC transporter ATP-binding protein [Candidatus Eisenbacteria bacterium]|nr:ABC transporter ATP-binding protein [Candidatus Eisenbacteria bacterium]